MRMWLLFILISRFASVTTVYVFIYSDLYLSISQSFSSKILMLLYFRIIPGSSPELLYIWCRDLGNIIQSKISWKAWHLLRLVNASKWGAYFAFGRTFLHLSALREISLGIVPWNNLILRSSWSYLTWWDEQVLEVL